MANYAAVVAQIAIINLVFSIDSIVTAVGMANEIWIMAVAVILSMMVLMFASGPVATFVEAHPTVKILALGFLIMIGMALVADSFGAHVPKGYIYTAMVFSVFIELINMKQRRKAKPVHLRNPYGEETESRRRRTPGPRAGRHARGRRCKLRPPMSGREFKELTWMLKAPSGCQASCRTEGRRLEAAADEAVVVDSLPRQDLLLIEASTEQSRGTPAHADGQGFPRNGRGRRAAGPMRPQNASILTYAVVSAGSRERNVLDIVRQLRRRLGRAANCRRYRRRQLRLGDNGAARRCRRLHCEVSASCRT